MHGRVGVGRDRQLLAVGPADEHRWPLVLHTPVRVLPRPFVSVEARIAAFERMVGTDAAPRQREVELKSGHRALADAGEDLLRPLRGDERQVVAEQGVPQCQLPCTAEGAAGALDERVEMRREVVIEARPGRAEELKARVDPHGVAVPPMHLAAPAVERLGRVQCRQIGRRQCECLWLARHRVRVLFNSGVRADNLDAQCPKDAEIRFGSLVCASRRRPAGQIRLALGRSQPARKPPGQHPIAVVAAQASSGRADQKPASLENSTHLVTGADSA